MLNKEQIEAIETRLLGIILGSDPVSPEHFQQIVEAVRTLDICRFLQNMPSLDPFLTTPDKPKEKEEEGHRSAIIDNNVYRLCSTPDVVVQAWKAVPDLDYEAPKEYGTNIGKGRVKPLSLLECKEHVYPTADGVYIVKVGGGNGGQSNWLAYLMQIMAMLAFFEANAYNAWIIGIKNDCLDDTFYCEIGIQHK